MTQIASVAPQLVMVAGPNGSGKSTLIAALRADPQIRLPALYINADDLQRERGMADSRDAQQLASQMRAEALRAGSDLMYETVMSHPAKLAELQRAKAAGYCITVHLVATDDPTINVARVGARVKAGGHDVPPDRIRARYARTLRLAPVALAYADQALLFDNSQGGDTGRGLCVHAVLQQGRVSLLADNPAQWVRQVAQQVNDRALAMETVSRESLAHGAAAQWASLSTGAGHRGPILFSGAHYLLQRDEKSHAHVVHDRILLGDQAASLATPGEHAVRYLDGVAEIS